MGSGEREKLKMWARLLIIMPGKRD